MAKQRDERHQTAMQAALGLADKGDYSKNQRPEGNVRPTSISAEDEAVTTREEMSASEEVKIALEASRKTVVSREKEVGEGAERPEGPVGLDVGTTTIVLAENRGKSVHTVSQTNAFFTIPYNNFTKNTLIEKSDIPFIEMNNQFYILGKAAENFANTFNSDTRRPIRKGIISATETDGIPVLQAILQTLIQRPKTPGETLYYTIPGAPLDGVNTVVYHSSIIRRYLNSLGYTATPINEGLAIIMSELPEDNFTGIAISMGGGMCNVCLAYLSVPIITFSIQKAGDYIDSMVGVSVGEPATKVKVIKESSLDLTTKPKTRLETALHIYYEDLISTLLDGLQNELAAADRIPKIAMPIPIVLSGGSALPKGVREMFMRSLDTVHLPVEISEVRIASDPLTSVARGALIKALAEENND